MFERPAVYLIEHVASGRVYVGSAANPSKRWSRHRSELVRGIHRNKHLQAAWTLYGAEGFRWRVLAVIEPSMRIWLEQRAIDALEATNPERGFNKAAIAGVSYGGTGHTWTPEQRAYLSALNKLAKPLHQPGTKCPRGHVKDGTYTRKRRNGSVAIRCQECERQAARDRVRRQRGIPLDHPRYKHFNRRGG